MSNLEKNLSAIKKYNPELASRILNHTQLNYSVDFCTASSEDTNIIYRDVLIHDKDDPIQQAYDLFHQLKHDKKTDIHIIFGLGLGYILKRFCLSAKGRILLLEPNLDILRLTLEAVDLSAELNRENVFVIDNMDDLRPYYEKLFFIKSDTTFTCLESYMGINSEIYLKLLEDIPYLTGIYVSNYKNLMAKSHLWTGSALNNMWEFLNHYNLEDLRGKFKGLPAVILSAGPSLDDSIEEIKKNREKCIVFATGAALKSAYKNGIVPDFALFVEFNDSNSQFFGLDLSETNVILQASTHKEVHKIKAKRIFNYYPNNDFLNKWLGKVLDIPLDDYYNKGTVSLTALFAAKICGCNPIILTGQDLAYTGGKCYTSSNPNNNLICVYNEELKKFEVKPQNEEVYLKEFLLDYDDRVHKLKYAAMGRLLEINEGLVSVKGQNGELIPTDGGYALFIKYFEEMAKVFDGEVKLYNASKGGAQIDGYENTSVETVLKNHSNLVTSVDNIVSKYTTKTLLESKKSVILSELKKLASLFEDSLPILEKGMKSALKAENEIKKNQSHSPITKRYLEDSINAYMNINNNFIQKHQAFLGLALKEFFEMSYYMETNDLNADYNTAVDYIYRLQVFFYWNTASINEILPKLKTAIENISKN